MYIFCETRGINKSITSYLLHLPLLILRLTFGIDLFSCKHTSRNLEVRLLSTTTYFVESDHVLEENHLLYFEKQFYCCPRRRQSFCHFFLFCTTLRPRWFWIHTGFPCYLYNPVPVSFRHVFPHQDLRQLKKCFIKISLAFPEVELNSEGYSLTEPQMLYWYTTLLFQRKYKRKVIFKCKLTNFCVRGNVINKIDLGRFSWRSNSFCRQPYIICTLPRIHLWHATPIFMLLQYSADRTF